MKIRCLKTAAAAIAAIATTASAYVRELDGSTPVSWVKDRTVVMQLSLGGPRTLSDGSTSFNQVAVAALSLWNTHLAHMQFSWVMNSPVTPAQGDDDMSVEFATSVFGDSFGNGTLAVTLLNYRNGNMEETDTLFNNKSYAWDSYRGPLRGGQDFRRVALHEFGHTVGLDHPDEHGQNVVAIMNSTMGNLDTLAQDDINGAAAIYGAGPAYQTIPSSAVLMNLSTRAVTSGGDSVLIGGFIVQGSQPARFVLRALGYSLASFSVANSLNDPVIEVYDSNNKLVLSNDDWFTSSQAPTIASYRRDPPNSIESAVFVVLNPGNYSAVVHSYSSASQPAQSGVALFELYDLRTTTSRAGNVSSRGHVGTGDDIMIAGFIIGGSASKPVIIRALGPTLSHFNVSGVLADPTLELRDANGNLIEANDDWQQSSQAASISAEGFAPSSAKEPVIERTLAPGNYTALVRGVNNTTGNALVEVYDRSPSP